MVVRWRYSRGGGQYASVPWPSSELAPLCSVEGEARISSGLSTKPAEPLKRAKWSDTARSTSLKFSATLCAPPSQQGSGLMLWPENRSWSHKDRNTSCRIQRMCEFNCQGSSSGSVRRGGKREASTLRFVSACCRLLMGGWRPAGRLNARPAALR
eukprot:5588926-Prymnesium_polylepis.1